MQRLLPPVLFLIFIVLMPVVCWAMGSPHTVSYPYSLIGLLFLLLGLGIASYHSRLFKKAGANIMTFGEPTRFVKAGLYRYSRNPMYLGFVVGLLGVALLYQAAPSSLFFVFLFWLVADRWYIRYEEGEMLRKFGGDYRDYCGRTPRWIGFTP